MELRVNGKAMQVTEGTTAAQLLQQLQIEPERVVVEVNVNILKRAQLVGTVLCAGDQVEIVHFVGGGSVGCSRLEVEGSRPRDTSLNLEP